MTNQEYTYSLLLVFGVLGYMMVKDRNVAHFFDLQIRIFGLNIRRYWIMAFLYVRIRFDTWRMRREFRKKMKSV